MDAVLNKKEKKIIGSSHCRACYIFDLVSLNYDDPSVFLQKEDV